MEDLFEDALKDIYWLKSTAESAAGNDENATSEKLKQGIDKHITETEGHVERLEECFKALGKKPDKNVMLCRDCWMKERALWKRQNREQ